jgi:CheY-like chemotaxis protein
MTDELFSLHVVLASDSARDRGLFRQAAAATSVPVELAEADSAAAATRHLGNGCDLAFFDMGLGGEAVTRMTAAARAAAKRPFTVLLCAPGTAVQFQTDALANKPTALDEATQLLAGCIRVRLPSRVLVVDDSATMRGIVRKILAATRFPLQITEAEQGGQAIELVRQSPFDVAFVDHHLPGLNGLETISELRREQNRLIFALMTSVQDKALMAKARARASLFSKSLFSPPTWRRSCTTSIVCGRSIRRARSA